MKSALYHSRICEMILPAPDSLVTVAMLESGSLATTVGRFFEDRAPLVVLLRLAC